MISGTIAGISSFTVYPLGEITIPRTSYSYYYISYTPSYASGTMWIKSTSTATLVSYQLSSYSGMLNFGNSYTQYLSFESFTCSSIETNIPIFKTYGTFFECGTLQRANMASSCIGYARSWKKNRNDTLEIWHTYHRRACSNGPRLFEIHLKELWIDAVGVCKWL